MHVLMISDVYFPRINGVSTSIETFRRDLEQFGISVSLVAPHYPEPHDAPATHRVPSRKVLFDPEDRLMHWKPLQRQIMQAATERVDLIHIQTPFAAHYAGTRAARELRVPAVTTYHTHFEEYIHHYLPLLPRRGLRSLARWLARSQCNNLDAVVVPSPAMRQTLSEYGVTAPLHVLPTGIPLERFAGGDRAAFRRRHDIQEERVVALYVGRVAHEKNIDFLLAAAQRIGKRLPQFLLVVAGEGPALPALRRKAAALGIDNHVRFLGYLDRQKELPDCYASADVFTFASRTETQGLVLLEAMAAGLPVYAFAEMGTREIVEPQRGAVVAPQYLSAFTDGLLQLLTDSSRLHALAGEAPRFAQSWSAPERARQLAELYRSLEQ